MYMYTFLHFQQEVYVIEARVEEGKCFVMLILFLKFVIYPLKILLKAGKSSNFFKNMVSELIQMPEKRCRYGHFFIIYLFINYIHFVIADSRYIQVLSFAYCKCQKCQLLLIMEVSLCHAVICCW